MNRVSTANSYNSVLLDLMRSQSRQETANNQVSSGKSATDLKGYARNAETLTATRAVKTRVDGFVDQSSALAAKLTSQDLALTQAADSAQSAHEAILSAVAMGAGQGLKAELQSWYASAAQALNTQHAGHYLFSGGQVDTKPVAAPAMADLTAGPLTSVFQNDQLTPTNRLDESTTIQSGFLADQLGTGLFSAFQQVQAYLDANGGDFPAKLDATATTMLNSVITQFDTARVDLTNAAAQNGLLQQRVDSSKKTQESRQTMLTGMIGDIADVDMADALARMQQAQTATQASAKVFQTLQNSSLLNYLN
ncbi:MAG: flagellin [Caulobacter sp.]|nr:flagellin [Caulobacter sp.]